MLNWSAVLEQYGRHWHCRMPRYSFQPLSMTWAFLSTASSPWPTTSLLSVSCAFSTRGSSGQSDIPWRRRRCSHSFRLLSAISIIGSITSHCKPTSSCPGRSHLRSATFGQLNFPCTKTDYGKRSLAVNGPIVWNSWPTEHWSPDISLDVFKAKLKTFLFNCWLS